MPLLKPFSAAGGTELRRIVGFFHGRRTGLSWFSTIRPDRKPAWLFPGPPLRGRGPASGLVLLACLGSLAWGCAAPPYQPALLFLPGREAGKVLRDAVAPVHTFFPRVRRLEKNLLLTEWVPLRGEPYPCRIRAEILARPVRGGTLLEIAVERSRLRPALLTEPAWVEEGGDRSMEEKLRKVLESQLGGRPVKPGGWLRRPPGSPGSG